MNGRPAPGLGGPAGVSRRSPPRAASVERPGDVADPLPPEANLQLRTARVG